MKKKKYYIFVIVLLLFILGSSYRFVQLNKDIWGQELYTEVSYNSTFNINGINFEVEKLEVLDNIDDLGSSDLKFSINLYKHGEITSEGFLKSFPENYPDSITLNITDKDEMLVGNYLIEFEDYFKDNPKFIEIQKGERNLGDKKESLIVRFRVDKNTMENIHSNVYNIRLVFPKDSNGLKFIFIDINLKECNLNSSFKLA
jgi:hypothetical protein